MINLSSFVRLHARRTPDNTALVFGKHRITWREFEDRIGHVAGWLRQRGIGADDIVAVLMKNSPAFLEIAFAVSHIGAVFLPINYRLAGDEVSYIVRHAGAKVLIADEEFASVVRDLPEVVFVDAQARVDSTRLSSGAPPADMVPRRPQDIFRLMYTSGTTARPKGVIHTYENFYWKSSDHVICLGLTAETRLLVVGPLYHVGAFDLPGIAVLWLGGTIVLQRDFDAAAVLDAIESERINGVWMAPVMTGAVLAEAARKRRDVSSLRWVIGGGDRTPESRIRAFAETFPNARYIDAYGLTETCSGDTFMEPGWEIAKIGSVGRTVAHLEIRIVDDHGMPLPTGENGEICLRGPKVTSGYWRDPERTAEAFYGEWFRTGDVGYLDADGFLYLTDRKKDLIVSGGENIASSEIERVLYEMPEIAEAAVVGVSDERWGERPVAVVVMAEGASFQPEAILAYCRAKLAGFKVPKTVIQRESLPRNPSGKVLKRLLREEITG
ncbi:MAG: long-chain-fatty-acid--CoA ligase [Acidobacteriia bacterium]|nr:long-chain-fatty-acid--CoA ligase [Methyloceanibacter sp.]MCL6492040.1 long-chain-fatty-acid--CoA ligase [Terriglobia bacterium]